MTCQAGRARVLLRRLTNRQVQAAIERLEAARDAHRDGDHGAFDRWLTAEGDASARLESPLGELWSQRIRGYVWAWATSGEIRTDATTRGDGFDAQGLEGKAVIQTSMTIALLVARDLPQHRVAVYQGGERR